MSRARDYAELVTSEALCAWRRGRPSIVLLDIIRQYGGEMKETYGVPVEEIQRGIKNGVRKVNVDTDNRLAITGAIRKVFATKRGEFDPRKYLGEAREAMKKICIDRMVAFGQAGNAGKIRPISCAELVRMT